MRKKRGIPTFFGIICGLIGIQATISCEESLSLVRWGWGCPHIYPLSCALSLSLQFPGNAVRYCVSGLGKTMGTRQRTWGIIVVVILIMGIIVTIVVIVIIGELVIIVILGELVIIVILGELVIIVIL